MRRTENKVFLRLDFVKRQVCFIKSTDLKIQNNTKCHVVALLQVFDITRILPWINGDLPIVINLVTILETTKTNLKMLTLKLSQVNLAPTSEGGSYFAEVGYCPIFIAENGNIA